MTEPIPHTVTREHEVVAKMRIALATIKPLRESITHGGRGINRDASLAITHMEDAEFRLERAIREAGF